MKKKFYVVVEEWKGDIKLVCVELLRKPKSWLSEGSESTLGYKKIIDPADVERKLRDTPVGAIALYRSRLERSVEQAKRNVLEAEEKLTAFIGIMDRLERKP